MAHCAPNKSCKYPTLVGVTIVQMKHSGNLRKMSAVLGDTVSYTLHLGNDAVDMNALIGKNIQLSFAGQINCVVCGNTIKKNILLSS